MKFLYLLLVCIVFASCSVLKVNEQSKAELKYENEKITLNVLPADIIRYVAQYLKLEEIVQWRVIRLISYSLPLKKLIEETFKISGLESIDDNEPELAWVMRFANIRIRHDPFRFFTALMTDVVEEKKPYKVLFGPLILHLFKTFSLLGRQERRECQNYFKRKFNESFESYIIKTCLLKNHFDLILIIARKYAGLSGKALRFAAQLGKTCFVELFLQIFSNISDNDALWALKYAIHGGHTPIVKNLLHSHTDISAVHVGWAIKYSAQIGQTQIFLFLLHSRTVISADDVGWALRYATLGGNIQIVEHLQNRTDIPAYHVGEALRIAAEKGHIPIVKFLLRTRSVISANDAGRALKYAAREGYIQIIEILQGRTDISAVDVGEALKHAARRGNIQIFQLLQGRTDISADDVACALSIAAKNGFISIVKLFSHHPKSR